MPLKSSPRNCRARSRKSRSTACASLSLRSCDQEAVAGRRQHPPLGRRSLQDRPPVEQAEDALRARGHRAPQEGRVELGVGEGGEAVHAPQDAVAHRPRALLEDVALEHGRGAPGVEEGDRARHVAPQLERQSDVPQRLVEKGEPFLPVGQERRPRFRPHLASAQQVQERGQEALAPRRAHGARHLHQGHVGGAVGQAEQHVLEGGRRLRDDRARQGEARPRRRREGPRGPAAPPRPPSPPRRDPRSPSRARAGSGPLPPCAAGPRPGAPACGAQGRRADLGVRVAQQPLGHGQEVGPSRRARRAPGRAGPPSARGGRGSARG